MSAPALQYAEAPTVLRVGNVKVDDANVQQVVSSLPTNFLSAANKGSALSVGAPVARHYTGTGIQAAVSTDTFRAAIGLATQGAGQGLPEMVQLSGLFCLADWTAITGQATLKAANLYWLGPTPGTLTTFAPATGISQIVGYAVSTITLAVNISPPILL